MVQTAEGSLQEISSILQRVRDLAVQYSNGTYSSADKAAITAEVTQLNAELNREIAASSFNGIALLGAAGTLATLQVGPNGTTSDQVAIAGVNASTSIGTAVSNFASGTVSLGAIDTAISNIAANRGTFGAVQNRLEHTINSLGSYQENLMGAESRIRDTDMAEELTNLTRLQILQQSGTAMLAQANMGPSGLLKLLGG
jgi:flagellin